PPARDPAPAARRKRGGSRDGANAPLQAGRTGRLSPGSRSPARRRAPSLGLHRRDPGSKAVEGSDGPPSKELPTGGGRMGYDVIITRAASTIEEAENPIPEEEWMAVVHADPTLELSSDCFYQR